ncbi:MAG: DegT/DnrJ/EryC1/StrS family aminotransferase [Candidatus Coatesbacteria bacterium]|nr:DegT/DnrJ/EryC1/StrS family aminotransferase [Candidatus Coatesbacteria bacterium]
MQVPLLDLRPQFATIRDEIREAIDRVLETQVFVLGPEVEKLEREIADYCGVKFGVGCASGTDALLLSLMAAGVSSGDEVITTPFTFFSTAGSVSRVGGTPVFVDIDPVTYNIDASLIEARITPRTKALIPVHLFGQCVNMGPVLEIAERHGLRVIEDAAQSIGSKTKLQGKWASAGSMGHSGCFSFFPTKNLGAYGDGGMVVSNDEDLAEKVRMLRVHGSKPKYHHSIIGANSRLDAIQAAVLRVKLKYLDDWSEARRKNANYYDKAFKGSGIITPSVRGENFSIYNQYVIRTKARDQVMEYLKKHDVGCEIYYPVPLHLQRCYGFLGYEAGEFPQAEAAAAETVALPIYPELTDEQKDYVVKCVLEGARQ